MMAGRNISVTHAALSSTRVMGTCSLLGQAAGTAAAIAVRLQLKPSQLYPNHIAALQETLMEDDCWLPGRRRTIPQLSMRASCDTPSVRSGHDRDVAGQITSWSGGCGKPLTLSWPKPENVGTVRLVFDSNLNNDKRMPCRYPQSHSRKSVPQSLVKEFRIESRNVHGEWEVVYRGANHQRLSYVRVNRHSDAIRFIAEETWGADAAKLFGFDAVPSAASKLPDWPKRVLWQQVVSEQDPQDLLPPDSTATGEVEPKRGVRA
jgi:hypothetical protein